MRVHRSGINWILVAPNIVEKRFTRLGATPTFDQHREEFKLGASQIETPPLQPDVEFAFVQMKIADLEDLAPHFGPRSPQQRLNPQDKLAGTERLRNVVISADFQAVNPFARFTPCGQHQDRQQLSFRILLERFAHGMSIHSGQHQVENEDVGPLFPGHLEPGEPIGGDQHAKPSLVEIVPEQVNHVDFVFDEEHSVAHGVPVIAEELGLWQAGKTLLGTDIAWLEKIRATRVRCSEQRKLNRGGPNMLP